MRKKSDVTNVKKPSPELTLRATYVKSIFGLPMFVIYVEEISIGEIGSNNTFKFLTEFGIRGMAQPRWLPYSLKWT